MRSIICHIFGAFEVGLGGKRSIKPYFPQFPPWEIRQKRVQPPISGTIDRKTFPKIWCWSLPSDELKKTLFGQIMQVGLDL